MITKRMAALIETLEDVVRQGGSYRQEIDRRRLVEAIEKLEKPYPLSRKGWKKLSRKRQLFIINSMGDATVRAWELEPIHIERMLEGMWDALDDIQLTLETR
jgi:hypothetical protein